jgi:hypothetical protein
MPDQPISPRVTTRLIGFIALSLPVLLLLIEIAEQHITGHSSPSSGCLACKPLDSYSLPIIGAVSPSISHSYCWGNITHNVFVGLLTGVGLLFLAFQGWGRKHSFIDKVIAFFCAALAIGVANFPTNSLTHSNIHTFCAVFLFVLLTYLATCRFTDDSGDESDTDQMRAWKSVRNGMYHSSSIAMLIGIGIAAYGICRGDSCPTTHYVLIGEWISLWGFGFGWLVKSRDLFGYGNGLLLQYRNGWENRLLFRMFSNLSCWWKRNWVCRLCGRSRELPATNTSDLRSG